MAREYEPVVGQWYEDLEDKESFRVLTVNEDEELIEIEYLEGDIEEIDLETWQELDLEKIDEPEGWSEGAFEKDDDDDEDLDEEWDEDEDEDDDDEDDDEEEEEEAGGDY